MKKIIHQFTETGEVRKPYNNEYILCGILPYKVFDANGWDEFPILIYERIEEDWKPKEDYYYISSEGIVIKNSWIEGNFDNHLYEYGNCFPTKELAEEKLKQIKEILK